MFEDANLVACDIETTGLDPYTSQIRLIQVSDGSTTKVFDMWDIEDQDIHDLQDLMQNHNTWKVFHNGHFDISFMLHWFGWMIYPIWDTMLAAQVLEGPMPPGHFKLDRVARRYIDVEMSKDQQRSNWSGNLTKAQLDYAAKDAEVLVPLAKEQKSRLIDQDLLPTARLEFDTVFPVIEMELAGIKIDVPAMKEMTPRVRETMWRSELEFSDIVYGEKGPQLGLDFGLNRKPQINVGSPQQVQEALKSLGLVLPNTKEATLRRYKGTHKAVECLLDRRHSSKVLGYLEAYPEHIHQTTGRMHPSYRQIGAVTGRFACSSPNIQNVPSTSDFRSLFIAEDGYSIMSADFSGQELRILAELTKEPTFIEAFNNGDDLHSISASRIYGIPVDDVDKATRTVAKNLCVPMDTEILTRRGYKSYGEVCVGEEVLGYNEEKEIMEWTTIKALKKYEEAPIMELSTTRFRVRTTPNHRFYGSKRMRRNGKRKYFKDQFTAEDMGCEHYMKLSAPASTTSRLYITPDEAAIIGWLFTDGTIQISDKPYGRSRGRQNRVLHEARILQSRKANPHKVKIIEDLLRDVPHSHYNYDYDEGESWALSSPYVRDLWKRARLDVDTLEQFVLNLGDEQRHRFIEACWYAEGCLDKDGIPLYKQNEGETHDAMRLAIFMEGFAPGTSDPKPSYTGNICKQIRSGRPFVSGQRMKKKELAPEEVWCVETGLGSWVMRQGGREMITGNSFGLLYGRGPKAFANDLDIPEDRARELIETYFSAYPKIREWIKAQHRKGERDGFVRSIGGRKCTLTMSSETGAWRRESQNYPVQSTGAEMMKAALVLVQRELYNYKATLIATIHDEMLLEVRDENIEEVEKLVLSCMSKAGSRYVKVVDVLADVTHGPCWRK